VADKKILTLKEAEECGMTSILDEMMPNGEKRFRRMNNEGSGYIRTEAPEGETKWQNAHYHEHTYELYVVQKGMILIAYIDERNYAVISLLQKNESFLIEPGFHHNVLMAPGSVIHTLKYGDAIPPNDWHASSWLDSVCKAVGKCFGLLLP